MKHVPGGHNLFVSDQDVNKRIENLYNRFKVSLKLKEMNNIQGSNFDSL